MFAKIMQKNRIFGLICVFICVRSASVYGVNKIGLLVPPAIYSVAGHEMNLYFDNIILVPNVEKYLFDVNCVKGRHDSARWRFIPEDKDVGKYPFNIKIIDEMNKVISERSSDLYVISKNAGDGKDITILLVGDSLTDASCYPNELNRLLQAKGNPKVKFIGSYAGGGREPDAEHIPHEGRSGWTWKAYCTVWKDDENHYRAKSPFLFMKEGKPQLDFQMYCDKYNNGKAPDFITVFLGCNDTFRANDENIDENIDELFKYADALISEFRNVSIVTQIGLIIPVPPSASQDAFGSSYTCGQTRWQYRRNQHRLAERMIEKYNDKEKDNIFLIPAYINIDCANNYPKGQEFINFHNTRTVVRDQNGVHPAKEGYYQIADSIYGWLKYRLNLN